jgi:pSer/pThr/pTyr-binding forkhead associated (FHA) protein
MAADAPPPGGRLSPGSFLFVEDRGAVLRFRLAEPRVRIGRAERNDIWVDADGVAEHAALIADKGDHHVLKVYGGARVALNDALVEGVHRLYSGDRFVVGDREFIYGRDDTAPDVALGLTVGQGERASRAVVLAQARVVVGRLRGDLPIRASRLEEGELVLECHGPDATFAWAPRGRDGQGRIHHLRRAGGRRPLLGRVRIDDGDTLQLPGGVWLRLTVLEASAFGLLDGQVARRDALAEVPETVVKARPSEPADDARPSGASWHPGGRTPDQPPSAASAPEREPDTGQQDELPPLGAALGGPTDPLGPAGPTPSVRLKPRLRRRTPGQAAPAVHEEVTDVLSIPEAERERARLAVQETSVARSPLRHTGGERPAGPPPTRTEGTQVLDTNAPLPRRNDNADGR